MIGDGDDDDDNDDDDDDDDDGSECGRNSDENKTIRTTVFGCEIMPKYGVPCCNDWDRIIVPPSCLLKQW